MPRKSLDPIIERRDKDPLSDSVERHPAYGQIGASRVHGQTYLYGSDFQHRDYVVIRIHTSELHRGLSHDWPYAKDQLIEVALSEAQWATFVSTLNMGMGTQCTIQHRQGQPLVPEIAGAPDRKAQITEEMRKAAQKGLEALLTLREEVDALKVSAKAREALMAKVETVERELASNIPYIAQTFGEQVEASTEQAKIEIHAYVQNVVQRAGVAALQGGGPIQLGPGDEPAAENAVCRTCGHEHLFQHGHDLLPWGRCQHCDCTTPSYGLKV
jgi:hypothetical protein